MLIVLCGALLAGMIHNNTKDQKPRYTTNTKVNTNVVTGFTIERTLSNSATDIPFTKIEYQNLISLASSYSTMEETAIRLFAKCLLLEEPDPFLVRPKNWEQAIQGIPPEELEEIRVLGNIDSTVQNIRKILDIRNRNAVASLILGGHDLFGVEHIAKTVVTGEEESDMISMTYTTSDPGICQATLETLTEVFIEKHRKLKEEQADGVLKFFEDLTERSSDKLREAEDALLDFRVDNNIINYYEQTRTISEKKEDLDEMVTSEMMNLISADTAVRELERQLSGRMDLPLLQQRIARKRKELNELSSQIARLEILEDTIKGENLVLLKLRAEQIKDEMRAAANEVFDITYTAEGLNTSDLLRQWLTNILRYEETEVRLNILKNRKEEFERIYTEFAPLGSIITRIEREINVSEKEFLENLKSYNTAQLANRNMLMSAQLQVVDPPPYPTSPAKSNRKLLIIIGFISGMLLPTAFFLALELMDSTLRKPDRAEEIIKMELVGAMPRIPSNPRKWKTIRYDEVQRRCLYRILQDMQLELLKVHSSSPHTVIWTSTRNNEGKTFISQMMTKHLRDMGQQVLYVVPETSMEQVNEVHIDTIYYSVNAELAVIGDLSYLYGVVINYSQHLQNPYDWIFVEVPGVLAEAFPLDKLHEADLVLMIARANKKWNEADEKALEQLRRGAKSKPKLLLNACRADVLEDIIGEIPKKRSRFRRMIKRYASFKMRERNEIPKEEGERRKTIMEKLPLSRDSFQGMYGKVKGFLHQTIKKG
ncbi:MAG: hypothetical protein AAF694_16825 [Bacteroidota bacterium]